MFQVKKQPNLPEIIDKDESEIRKIISLIKESTLSEEVKAFVIKCIELALWFPLFLQKKNISLHRLRESIFGKGYHKNKKNKNNPASRGDLSNPLTTNNVPPLQNQLNQGKEDETSTSLTDPDSLPVDNTTTKKKPGHGRMPHTVYEDTIDIRLLLNLTVGDDCPALCGGKLGPYNPGIIIRIKGSNFAQVYRYTVEKLRCNLCNIIIAAYIPTEVGTEKYDASFKAMLALMKYYMAMPFYRQEHFQRMLNFPLSDATQWDLIEELASYCYAPFNILKEYAANGQVIQHDDTTITILEVIKQIKEGNAGERTGTYTTGVIANYEGRQIALFMNGRQHSGENVSDILKLRSPEKEPILQMCDALSANIPKAMKTILCNCLAHGFRKFSELVDFFPPECLIIMDKLSKVFQHDEETRGMSDQKRLAYHQKYSQPIMDELKHYMERLMDEHRVEPNSELGKALKYMQKHWVKLTRFLSVAGTPIDNNIVERSLKIAIRNRKSAMFYRTVYSAGIGGMITSLIYTCHLANQNPHKYLIALQVYQDEVLADPKKWLPWNYLDAISEQASVANLQAHAPPVDSPVAA